MNLLISVLLLLVVALAICAHLDHLDHLDAHRATLEGQRTHHTTPQLCDRSATRYE